jgi:hypothetical protein
MMRKLLAWVILVVLPLNLYAQVGSGSFAAPMGPDGRAIVADLYNPSNDAAFVYCLASGERRVERGSLNNVSASTTVTGNDAIFTGMAVGDLLYFRSESGGVTTRAITTFTSTTSVVVNSSLTITGASTSLRWREVTCGTGTSDGWIDVADYPEPKLVQLDITTLGSASVTMTVEGRIEGGSASTLLTTAAVAATGSTSYVITEPVSSLRVGLKVTTDGTDVVRVLVRGVK